MTKELIEAGALRQFKHNDGSEGLVFAYDKAIVDRVLASRCRAQGGETINKSSEHAPQAASPIVKVEKSCDEVGEVTRTTYRLCTCGGAPQAATTASAGYSKVWSERMLEKEISFDGNIEAGAAPVQAAQPALPTDEQIISALHANGIDTYPSKYGFDAVQVSATSVPNLRKVIESIAASLAGKDKP